MLAAELSTDFWATTAQVSAALFIALVVEIKLLPSAQVGAMPTQVATLAVIALATMLLPLGMLIADGLSSGTYRSDYIFFSIATIELVLLGIQGWVIVNALYPTAKRTPDPSSADRRRGQGS